MSQINLTMVLSQSHSYKERISQRILSFAQHADRRSWTLVSKKWYKETYSFFQKIVDKALHSNLTIFLPLATADFLDHTMESLRTIVKTSTGERLLHRLSLTKTRITIYQDRNTCAFKAFPNSALEIAFRDTLHENYFILKRSNGRFVFSSLIAASGLMHELIHALHYVENRFLGQYKYEKDAYFGDAEEMLTVSGIALKDKDWIIDPINENAFRKELELDPRVFHFGPPKSDLEEAAVFGVDGAFVDWIQKGHFNNQKAVRYLTRTIEAILHGFLDTGRRFTNEKHLKIIKLLTDAGCDTREGYKILHSEWFVKNNFSEAILDVIKRLSYFPLHDLITYKWKRAELECYITAFLKKEGSAQLAVLLHTKNARKLTPLQLAENMWQKVFTVSDPFSEVSSKKLDASVECSDEQFGAHSEALAESIVTHILDDREADTTEAAFYKDIIEYFRELETTLFSEPVFDT